MAKDSFPMIRWLIVAAIAAAILIFGLWYWRHQRSAAPTFITATVARGDLTQIVTATGQLNPVVTVQVGSQISGIIQKLFVDFNSPVQKGQVVAQIDPSIYQANVIQAEGELASAKAALELAKANRSRAERLFAQNAAPQATLDKAVADYDQAEANVRIKEGALEKARVDLAHCTIYAPIDGIVISRNVDVGQTVAASLSAPTIFVIANDLTRMQIDANVAEADIGNVAMDQNVDFTVDAFPYRVFHGRVMQVRNAPITVQNVVTYDTVIEVNNADLKLKPGMTANVSIVVARREGVLKLGNAALRVRLPEGMEGGKAAEAGRGEGTRRARAPSPGENPADRYFSRVVYVLPSETAKPEPVRIRIGISDGISTEVVEGLKEGDRVITGVSGAAAGPQTTTSNPFSGGVRRF